MTIDHLDVYRHNLAYLHACCLGDRFAGVLLWCSTVFRLGKSYASSQRAKGVSCQLPLCQTALAPLFLGAHGRR
jgi:hypothetical protein